MIVGDVEDEGTVIIEGLPADDPTSMFFLDCWRDILQGEGLKAPPNHPQPDSPAHFFDFAQRQQSCWVPTDTLCCGSCS